MNIPDQERLNYMAFQDFLRDYTFEQRQLDMFYELNETDIADDLERRLMERLIVK